MRAAKTKTARAGFDRGAFFRVNRMLHAYLSAFAFLLLIFFSATGILLNHPEWFDAYKPAASEADFTLSSAELSAAKAAQDPGPSLARAAAAHAPLPGAYASADIEDGQALVRLDGPKGSADLTIDLASGKTQARIGRANFLAIAQDLHRGKNSGVAWRWVIDVSAWLVMGLSLVGYVLFFSLRFRLRNSLILTAVSLLTLTAIAWFCVP
ncbi:MAG TPA: PepSY-associated TM helix domain-containing protein [Caulobacteraceae bacterium]|nr:PepSY-associated TM helix domain-containing protein [Caulobacteraceae bacterium]